MVSLACSGIRPADATFLGWFGPRGLASIVFGMLAFASLTPADDLVAEVMVITVLIGVVVHGVTGGLIATAYARRAQA